MGLDARARRVRRFTVTVVVLGSLLQILSTTPDARAGHLSCTLTAQKPHWSDGANGIIAKANMQCTAAVDGMLLIGHLYFCGTEDPRNDKEWLEANCDLYLSTNPIIPPPIDANEKVTRYMPPQTDPGVRRTGWYKAYAISTVDDTHSGESKEAVYRDFSPDAYCNHNTHVCTP